MHHTIDKQQFSKALSALGVVVPKRYASEAITDRVLIRGGRIVATDCNIYAALSLRWGGIAEGEAVFPYSGLKAAAKGKGTMDLTAHNGTVSASGMSWPAGPVEDFPGTPKAVEETASVVVEGRPFREALALGSLALAREEGRYLFDHVLLDIACGTMSVVTTDGRRMAQVQLEAFGQDGETLPECFKGRVLVSPAGVKVLRYLADVQDGVRLSWTPEKLFAESSEGEVYITLRDAAGFPDFRPHIDGHERTLLATVERKPFLEAMEACANTEANLVATRFEFTVGGGIHLVTQTGSEAKYVGNVLASCERQECIHLRASYLVDALKALKAPAVEIRCGNPEDGIVLQAGSFRYLVMPVLIKVKKGE